MVWRPLKGLENVLEGGAGLQLRGGGDSQQLACAIVDSINPKEDWEMKARGAGQV